MWVILPLPLHLLHFSVFPSKDPVPLQDSHFDSLKKEIDSLVPLAASFKVNSTSYLKSEPLLEYLLPLEVPKNMSNIESTPLSPVKMSLNISKSNPLNMSS